MEHIIKIHKIGNNQYYFNQGDKMVFQSYDTTICIIENYYDSNHPVIKITKGQPESKTTAKYLNLFLRKFTLYDNYKKIES